MADIPFTFRMIVDGLSIGLENVIIKITKQI